MARRWSANYCRDLSLNKCCCSTVKSFHALAMSLNLLLCGPPVYVLEKLSTNNAKGRRARGTAPVCFASRSTCFLSDLRFFAWAFRRTFRSSAIEVLQRNRYLAVAIGSQQHDAQATKLDIDAKRENTTSRLSNIYAEHEWSEWCNHSPFKLHITEKPKTWFRSRVTTNNETHYTELVLSNRELLA